MTYLNILALLALGISSLITAIVSAGSIRMPDGLNRVFVVREWLLAVLFLFLATHAVFGYGSDFFVLTLAVSLLVTSVFLTIAVAADRIRGGH